MAVARRCFRCGTTYPPHLVEAAFRTANTRGRLDASKRRCLCRPCEQTARDERKIRNRWAVKARDVVRRHALRLGASKEDLVNLYGWDVAQLSHDAKFQYHNGCNYCGHSYGDMGHGLADITLDVIDRSLPPYYRTNTKWCCQTCNRKKGDRGPAWFEADLQVFQVWKAERKRDPQVLGFLF